MAERKGLDRSHSRGVPLVTEEKEHGSSLELGEKRPPSSSSKRHPGTGPAVTVQEPPTSGSKNLGSSAVDGDRQRQRPFFYYQNRTDHPSQQQQAPPRHFSLHSDPSGGRLKDNYGTTLTLIIFLHVVFFLQWNARRSRRDVCTSYEELVERRRFYKAALAVASHPPKEGGERDTNNAGSAASSSSEILGGGGVTIGADDGSERRNSFYGRIISCNVFNRIPVLWRFRLLYLLVYRRILHPLMYGSLSGLPLLTYSSHILWQCRALEELYDEHDGELTLGIADGSVNATQLSGIGTAVVKMQGTVASEGDIEARDGGYAYHRVLLALALTSLLLELAISRSAMGRTDVVLVGLDGQRHRPREILGRRAICSTAALSAALLVVYDSRFPYAPTPVMPFLQVPFLTNSGFSSIYSMIALAALSHRIHPVTSVMSGLMSGSIWSLGITSFLGTRRWGNAMISGITMAMLLSMKADPRRSRWLEVLAPCIDYVAWDSDGQISHGGASSASTSHLNRRNSTRMHPHGDGHGDDDEDVEMGSRLRPQIGHHGGGERFPLLSSQSSSTGSGGGGGGAIRGRVPLIDTMESDLMDRALESATTNRETEVMPSASSPRSGLGLSRRASGAGVQ